MDDCFVFERTTQNLEHGAADFVVRVRDVVLDADDHNIDCYCYCARCCVAVAGVHQRVVVGVIVGVVAVMIVVFYLLC